MTPNSMKYNPAFLDDETLIRSFVVRNTELARILEVIRDNTDASNQHVLIIGPRGIGKTTLVLRSAAEVRTDPGLGSDWHPVVFGEETYQVSTPGEFWLEALFHLGQQTGEARWQQAYEELLRERDDDRLCGRAISQLMDFADAQGKRLLLVVENLNMLVGGQISSNAAWVLRKTLMNEPRLMLLGTATSRFDAIDEYNQALYELFRIIEVEPLDQEEAQALWAASTGQDAPVNRIRPLQILTGGNPRLIRILSEFAAKTSFSSLMDDLTRLVDEHTEYFKHHLDSLPPQERKVFVVLADLWDPSTARKVADAARLDVNTTSALLKRLVERGAVTAPYKRGRAQYYQVAERMYNVYHLMRRRGTAASRVHAVVRFMVRFYRDKELLQTTRSLVEEARGLTAERRQELFTAYEAIVHQARKPRLKTQIIEATRHAFKTMPDAPPSLLKLVGLAPPLYSGNSTLSDGLDISTLQVEAVEDVETLLRLAEGLAQQPNQVGAAEAAFQKALKLDPNNVSAWWQFAEFQLDRMRRADLAVTSNERALQLAPDVPSLWFKQGFILYELGRFQEAAAAYEHAVRLSPDDAGALHNQGLAYLKLERNEDAFASFDRASALNPTEWTTWHNRAIALAELGRAAEAIHSSDRALAIDPSDPNLWSGRGVVAGVCGNHLEALEYFDRALNLDPDNAGDWYNRGVALGKLGRRDEEAGCYERALALDPQMAEAWHNRGVILEDLGQLGDALESYDRALALAPANAGTWYNRGVTLGKLGRYEEELVAYDRALALDPNDAATWHNRGVALANLGKRLDALESLDRAVILNPTDVSSHFLRGVLLGWHGNWERALEHAPLVLQDDRLLDDSLDAIINFFIGAVAAGQEDEVLRIINASGRVEAFEPLVVAIQRLAGTQVDVAREVMEVANDVIQRIEDQRSELRSAGC